MIGLQGESSRLCSNWLPCALTQQSVQDECTHVSLQ